MVKNSFFSLISQEEREENWEFVEFQILNLTNKIRRLHLAFGIAQKRLFLSRGLHTWYSFIYKLQLF